MENSLLSRIKTCFRYSFIGKLTEFDSRQKGEFLTQSRALKRMEWGKERILFYSQTSYMVNAMRGLKNIFYVQPLKAGALFALIGILTYWILTLICHRRLSLWGWSVTGVSFCLATIGFFCPISFKDLKRTSFVLKDKRQT